MIEHYEFQGASRHGKVWIVTDANGNGNYIRHHVVYLKFLRRHTILNQILFVKITMKHYNITCRLT